MFLDRFVVSPAGHGKVDQVPLSDPNFLSSFLEPDGIFGSD